MEQSYRAANQCVDREKKKAGGKVRSQCWCQQRREYKNITDKRRQEKTRHDKTKEDKERRQGRAVEERRGEGERKG